jgi:tetratricopeptide (TPR) repeat protein
MKMIQLLMLFFTVFLFSQNEDIYKQIDEHSNNYRYVKASEVAGDWIKNNPNDVKALWRLAKAHFEIADQSLDPAVHKEHFYPGLEFAKKALDLNPKSARANHWYAVLIGKIGIIEGTEQKIINSYDVKKYGKISIELDPKYDGSYHLMGRWHYNVADLSWIERSIASWVYATPPEGSFEEAVEFFKKAISTNNDEIRHYLWLAKSYYELSDYGNTKKICEDALKILPKNKSDEILQKQAKELLSDL